MGVHECTCMHDNITTDLFIFIQVHVCMYIQGHVIVHVHVTLLHAVCEASHVVDL